MTLVTFSYGKDGVIKECKANGHAGFSKKGSDIVCAAVTILFRTAIQVISQIEGVGCKADISSRGNLAFRVDLNNRKQAAVIRLCCAMDFLRVGIESLTREYPENVQMREIINDF